MKKRSPITEETRFAILDAAWSLIAEQRRLDVSQAEIAARAGVSRQTLYLAFGSRAELLVAMLRGHDRRSPLVGEMIRASRIEAPTREDLCVFLSAWLRYLPELHPVAMLVDAASVTDPTAAEAWNNRIGTLRSGLQMFLQQLQETGELKERWTPARAADFTLSLIHPTAWRVLVVDRGWTPDEFHDDRMVAVEKLVLA